MPIEPGFGDVTVATSFFTTMGVVKRRKLPKFGRPDEPCTDGQTDTITAGINLLEPEDVLGGQTYDTFIQKPALFYDTFIQKPALFLRWGTHSKPKTDITTYEDEIE